MFRKTFYPTRFALSIIAIENIAPKCDCFMCLDGFLELCIVHFTEAPLEAYLHDRSYETYCDMLDDRGELRDDEIFDRECNHYVEWFGADDANPSDEWHPLGEPNEDEFLSTHQEPRIRVSKSHRSRRVAGEVQFGMMRRIKCGTYYRAAHAKSHDFRKKHYHSSRLGGECIPTVLLRREEVQREYWRSQDVRYWQGYFPEDSAELHLKQRAELLRRNFPALSECSVQCISTSRSIQNSSSFVGLELLQREEEELRRYEEKYFDEDAYHDDMENFRALIHPFNQSALLALGGQRNSQEVL